jgi:ligand-binding sensor domain-containing protein
MKRRLVFFLFIYFIVAAAAPAAWRNVVSRTWVSDVAADGDAIWLSYLGGGAARYETRTGNAYYYTAAEGLVHNYVTAVAPDKDSIYFASRNGLATLPRASAEFEHTIRTWGFAHNDCTDVAADNRYVYVATLEGARRYDKAWGEKTFQSIPPEEGPPSRLSPQVEDGWKVYVTPDGVVLDDLYSVTAVDGTLYWGGRGRLFASAPGAEGWREVGVELPTMAVVRRVFARGATLVVATDEGAFLYDGETTARLEGPAARADVRDALSFAGLEYYATAEGLFVMRPDDEPFKFAAGTGAEWTKVKDARKKKSTCWRLGVPDGLPSSRCTALASREESLIIGTENGACVLEPASGKVWPLPLAKGLPPGGVYAAAYGDGEIWAATPNGLAAVDAADSAVEKYELPGGWNDVRDVRYYEGEVLLTSGIGVAAAGPESGEIKYFERAGGERFADLEGTRAVKFAGRYFVGTTAGVLELDGGLEPVKFYGEAAGFPPYPVRAILPLDGRLLCATLGGGLVSLEPGTGDVGIIEEGAGISSNVLFSLAADDEHVYVGTYDKGVDVLDQDLNFEKNISWGDGLSHTDIWAEAVDAPWLWLAIRGVGVNAYNLETGEVRRYYARYGLGDEYCKSIAVLPPEGERKRLAFGTASGVAIFEYEGEPPDYAAADYDGNYP